MINFLKLVGLIGLIGLMSPMGRLGAAPIPESVITWQAQNYAPGSFLGKKLPIRGTTINFAIQLIDNNQLIDASDKEVRWYTNSNLIKSGIGLNNFTYTIPLNSEDLLLVRSVIIYQGVEVNQFLEIPVVDPEVVIDSSQLPQLKPYFYFFNITSPDDLELDWGESADSITLAAQNLKNPLEAARATIKKQ